MALGTPLRPLGRGHRHSSHRADMPDTREVGRGGEEGLTREEGAELGGGRGAGFGSRLSFQPCSFVIGALERKFTFNPLLTS